MIAGAVQIHPWLIIFDFLSMPGICPGRTIAIAHAPRLLRDGDDSSLFVGLPEQDVGIFNLAWRGTMRPAVSNTGSECPLLALGANGAAALGGIELRHAKLQHRNSVDQLANPSPELFNCRD